MHAVAYDAIVIDRRSSVHDYSVAQASVSAYHSTGKHLASFAEEGVRSDKRGVVDDRFGFESTPLHQFK